MNAVRAGTPGATKPCPHCRATILERSAVCPACRGHLRFDASPADAPAREPALLVEGELRADRGEALEYTMVLSIRNERGEEVSRHVVGVGALEGSQVRRFSVAVQADVVPDAKRRRSR